MYTTREQMCLLSISNDIIRHFIPELPYAATTPRMLIDHITYRALDGHLLQNLRLDIWLDLRYLSLKPHEIDLIRM